MEVSMQYSQFIPDILLFLICFSFYKFVKHLFKKENMKIKNMYLSLSLEDIDILKLNEYQIIENKRKMWSLKGKIVSITPKRKYYYIDVIWYDNLPNHTNYEDFHCGKLRLTKQQVEDLNIEIDKFVNILIIPNKQEKMVVIGLLT